jgi:predicted  nucleic acid-binding Zn-ribbon protein
VLYEKTNIQESIIKNGENEITKLEDEVRMIRIEISEVQRKVEASRKKVPEIPKLAGRVKQLYEELNTEIMREAKLSNELERTENKDRWREVPGEDPDPEALKAKIQVLEERLNSKKEALLEKELILDEVTNISENLRKQSIESRRETLHVSSTVNDLQARLKNITRKMMATISELSMYQANVIKLESEKNELYSYLHAIRERVEAGLPPTDESEIEFLKILRDKKRYLEMREEKNEQEMIRNSMPPFAVNSTAEPRPGAYIDQIGLPKPYGAFRPFRPSELGANLRHYKPPEIRDPEI